MELLLPTCEFAKDPSFTKGREMTASIVRDLPEEILNIEDSLQAQLIHEAQPGYIFPSLIKSVDAEQQGLVELHLRAHMDYEKGILQILLNGESVDCTYMFDAEETKAICGALDPEQYASFIRYAYSRREEQLDRKIKKGPKNMLALQERLLLLEGHCRRRIDSMLREEY